MNDLHLNPLSVKTFIKKTQSWNGERRAYDKKARLCCRKIRSLKINVRNMADSEMNAMNPHVFLDIKFGEEKRMTFYCVTNQCLNESFVWFSYSRTNCHRIVFWCGTKNVWKLSLFVYWRKRHRGKGKTLAFQGIHFSQKYFFSH